MKIDSAHISEESTRARRSELEELLQALDLQLVRPCAGCNKTCSCSRRSPNCPCSCSPSCPDAPRRLSSEPDRYPIEGGVLPLVFAFHKLRVVHPCWSCEGHLESSHLKLPQVWFYAKSAIYPELIGRYVSQQGKRLSAPWSIAICEHQPDPRATTFVLMPTNGDVGTSALKQLQQDLRTLADGLVEGVRRLAQAQLRELEQR